MKSQRQLTLHLNINYLVAKIGFGGWFIQMRADGSTKYRKIPLRFILAIFVVSGRLIARKGPLQFVNLTPNRLRMIHMTFPSYKVVIDTRSNLLVVIEKHELSVSLLPEHQRRERKD